MEILYALEEVDKVAKQILDKATSRTFLFYGKVGAGKTTLIKALASHLEVTDTISSPTFSLVNEHVTASGDKLFHFDLYRIKDVEEALDIGIEDYLDSGAWIFIEWPDKVVSLLADSFHKIEITHQDSGQRLLKLSTHKL